MRAYLRYAEHRGPALADSVTYRALFSLFAAALLGFSLAALWLGGNPDAMNALIAALDSVIPGLTDAIDLRSVKAPGGFALAGIVSLVGLIAAAIGAIGSLRQAIRELADTAGEDAGPVFVLLRQILVAVAFGGLLLVAAVLSVASSAGLRGAAEVVGLPLHSTALEWIVRAAGIVTVFAIDTAAIALMFWLLSGVRAPARALWTGAAAGGVALVVLQELSGLFVRGAAANPLLASFAALVALLLWVNLSVQVILLSSSLIIVGTAEAHDRVRERYGASTLAQFRRRRAEDRLQVAAKALRIAQEAEAAERSALHAAR